MEEKSVQIFIPCEISFSLVFWEEEWWVGGNPFYLKFWVNRPPLERNRRFSTDNCSSAVTPSEKVQLTLVGSPLRSFKWWSSYVAPKSPKGGSKTQNVRFSSKIVLRLKKVCYKVSLCEKCQRQSCKAFIGLTNRAKNDWWGMSPSTWHFGSKWSRWNEIANFLSLIAPKA